MTIDDDLVNALVEAAQSEGGWLQIIQGEEARLVAADLVAEADRLQWSNRRFRHELAA